MGAITCPLVFEWLLASSRHHWDEFGTDSDYKSTESEDHIANLTHYHYYFVLMIAMLVINAFLLIFVPLSETARKELSEEDDKESKDSALCISMFEEWKTN